MDEIAENCTRVAVFSDGEVKYVLPPKELFLHAEELLKELFLHAEELLALGLDVPLTAKICLALKEYGIRLECDFTTEDFLKKALALQGKGGSV